MSGVSDQTFPQFSRLPRELRLIIWQMALPGPRVVTIRQKLLQKSFSQWWNETHDESESVDHQDFGGEAWRQIILSGPVFGIKPDNGPPAILSACREAYGVASKFYERVFSVEHSIKETYFDFHLDTLYLRYDDFGSQNNSMGLIIDSVPGLDDEENLKRVERLAILIDPEYLGWPGRIEEWLVSLLHRFEGAKNLSLVLQHYESADPADNADPVCLIAQMDFRSACLNYSFFVWGQEMEDYLFGIPVWGQESEDDLLSIPPNFQMKYADLDLHLVLQMCRASQGLEYVLPGIEFKIAVSQKENEEWETLQERARRLMDAEEGG